MIAITLRKLEALAPRTRDRKVLVILGELRARWSAGDLPTTDDFAFLRAALSLTQAAGTATHPLTEAPTLRDLVRWQQRIEASLGLSSADWDLQTPGDRAEPGRAFPLTVYLEDLRSPFNVGSIFRTAEAFGFERVLLSPHCPAADHPRVLRTAMGSQHHLEVQTLALEDLAVPTPDVPIIALELGGTPIESFRFPPRGILLLGSEELGLSPQALALADASGGRISIPLHGRKASLNVGVAFGIAAAAWTSALTAT